MTRRTVWGALVAAALMLVLAAALVYILQTAAGLEAAEREARRLAAHEERVRLALWRLDSTLSGFLAYENARPPGLATSDYELQDDEEAFVTRRFELGAEHAPDPSLPPLETLLASVGGELSDFEFSSPSQPQPQPQPQPPVPSAEDPVALEAESQMVANTMEFNQRQSFAGQQAQFISPPTPVMRVETARSGLLRPLWRETDDATSLLLVRRVDRDGEESVQGMELDLATTRAELLQEIRDLLPAATLEPVLDPSTADPARRLALLPLRLDPGPPQPLADPAGWSASRLGLTTAVVAVALAALAGGLLVLAAVRLARRRADFASAVVHELRTPLTTFRFYTDMLAEGMVAEDDRQSYAETLRREADRLGHLVENVLAYARLERKAAITPSADDRAPALEDWARDVEPRLRGLAESQGFSFSWHDASLPAGLRLAADPLSVDRILHNLCDNSCKYGSRENGADEDRIEVRLEPGDDGGVRVRWRDFGPGLDAAARKDLFRAFRRGEVEGTTGIGLGLALSRQLARDFGGDLRPLDPDGPGTLFELTLPVSTS